MGLRQGANPERLWEVMGGEVDDALPPQLLTPDILEVFTDAKLTASEWKATFLVSKDHLEAKHPEAMQSLASVYDTK